MNISAELSALQQALLVEHLRGPVPVIVAEQQRQVTRRALLQKGLLKPHPLPHGKRFTAITARGTVTARALLATPAAA